MKNKRTKFIDDSLIISRLQQKELLSSKSDLDFDLFFPLMSETLIRPFFDNNPIKVGLRLRLIGNNIIHLHIDRGYFHHGLEEIIRGLPLKEAILALGRLHYKAPIFYQIALLMAWQALYDQPFDTQPYAKALEFSRIAHHLNVIRNIFYCLELYALSDLINEMNDILAKPFSMSERIYTEETDEDMPTSGAHQNILDALSLMNDIHHRIMQEERLQIALIKKAHVDLKAAASLGLTGPYLRANRCYYDLRHTPSHRHFYENPPAFSVVDGGDAWARFSLRILEIITSLSWLRKITSNDISSRFKAITIVKDVSDDYKKPYSMASIDSPEGDIKVSIFVDVKTESNIFRLRTPAYFIAQSLPQMLRDANLQDVGLLLNSLGISAEEIDK